MSDFFKQNFCERCDFYEVHKQSDISTNKFDCDPYSGKCTARTIYKVRIQENPVAHHIAFFITKGKRHWKESLLPKDTQIESLGNRIWVYYRNTLDEAEELVDKFSTALSYDNIEWTYDVDKDISELSERW